MAGWIEGYLYKHDPEMRDEDEEGPEGGGKDEELKMENGDESVVGKAQAVDDVADMADGMRIQGS